MDRVEMMERTNCACARLMRSGVASELLYIPKENHIMEMVAFTYDEDPTAKRIARFILDGGK